MGGGTANELVKVKSLRTPLHLHTLHADCISKEK